jgi:hypothetical protein
LKFFITSPQFSPPSLTQNADQLLVDKLPKAISNFSWNTLLVNSFFSSFPYKHRGKNSSILKKGSKFLHFDTELFFYLPFILKTY